MANVNTKERPRGRQAYLNYDQIQPFIDSGKLDQYDEIFCKDRNIKVYIDKDLNIREIKSTNDVFNSESEALTTLNQLSSGWFAGQLIAIRNDGKYLAYTVNYDSETQKYSISQIDNCIVDYNYLENRPIENLIANGTILSELANGTYAVTGTYRICESDPTQRIIADKILYTIRHDANDDSVVYITELSDMIRRYTCTDEEFVNDRYALVSELREKVIEVLDDTIDDYIDENIEENTATDTDINNLFS